MLTILNTENLMRNWQVSVVSSAFEMNRFRDLYNSDIKFVYYNGLRTHKTVLLLALETEDAPINRDKYAIMAWQF